MDCAGASITTLNVAGISSWGGVVSGAGSWAVTYPANGVYLNFFIDGVPHGTQYVQGDSNRSGSWSFNTSPMSCGSHAFEVRASPAVFDSSSSAPGWFTASGALSRTATFVQACPTATLSCLTNSPFIGAPDVAAEAAVALRGC